MPFPNNEAYYAMPLPSQRSRTVIEEFYMRYPTFPYNPSAEFWDQFHRLCKFNGWERCDERNRAYEAFRIAMVEQFNKTFGENADDIKSWRYLCQILRVSPIPRELRACRKAVLAVHVNLVDLTKAGMDNVMSVRIFQSERELSEYTQMTKKFFPKEDAYEGGLLRYLLRHIFDPADDDTPPVPGDPPRADLPPVPGHQSSKRKRDDTDSGACNMGPPKIPKLDSRPRTRPNATKSRTPLPSPQPKAAMPPALPPQHFPSSRKEQTSKTSTAKTKVKHKPALRVLPPVDLTKSSESSSTSQKPVVQSNHGLPSSPIDISDSEDDQAHAPPRPLPQSKHVRERVKPAPRIEIKPFSFSFRKYQPTKPPDASQDTPSKKEEPLTQVLPPSPVPKAEPLSQVVPLPSLLDFPAAAEPEHNAPMVIKSFSFSFSQFSKRKASVPIEKENIVAQPVPKAEPPPTQSSILSSSFSEYEDDTYWPGFKVEPPSTQQLLRRPNVGGYMNEPSSSQTSLDDLDDEEEALWSQCS